MSQEYPGRNHRLLDDDKDEPQQGDDFFHPWLHEWRPWNAFLGKQINGLPIPAYRRRVRPDSIQDKQVLVLQTILNVIHARGNPADKLSTIYELAQAGLGQMP